MLLAARAPVLGRRPHLVVRGRKRPLPVLFPTRLRCRQTPDGRWGSHHHRRDPGTPVTPLGLLRLLPRRERGLGGYLLSLGTIVTLRPGSPTVRRHVTGHAEAPPYCRQPRPLRAYHVRRRLLDFVAVVVAEPSGTRGRRTPPELGGLWGVEVAWSRRALLRVLPSEDTPRPLESRRAVLLDARRALLQLGSLVPRGEGRLEREGLCRYVLLVHHRWPARQVRLYPPPQDGVARTSGAALDPLSSLAEEFLLLPAEDAHPYHLGRREK
jgi:hypothetical protein